MEKIEVKYYKFIPGEGKSIKWVEKDLDGRELKRYSPYIAVIDVNSIVGEVEEVDIEEYNKFQKGLMNKLMEKSRI